MFQFLTKLDYLLHETFLGIRRGGWMNWAAVSTVTVLLFLFGTSLQASWQLEGLLNQFGSQLEMSVYLNTGIQAEDLQPIVAKLPEVTAVTAIPKEVAWKNLVQELGLSDINQATQQLAGNPLVDELKVKVRSSPEMAAVAQKLAKVKGVEEVRYVDEVVQRVAQLNRGLNWVSLTVTTLLTLTSIAVITTTIRLIVLARRREIEVMQLVGATTLWIYLPFILQGLALGVTGAAIAWGFLSSLQQFLKNLLFQQPELVQFLANGLQLRPAQRLLLPLILLGFGGTVGLLGSLFAVRTIAPR